MYFCLSLPGVKIPSYMLTSQSKPMTEKPKADNKYYDCLSMLCPKKKKGIILRMVLSYMVH